MRDNDGLYAFPPVCPVDDVDGSHAVVCFEVKSTGVTYRLTAIGSSPPKGSLCCAAIDADIEALRSFLFGGFVGGRCGARWSGSVVLTL